MIRVLLLFLMAMLVAIALLLKTKAKGIAQVAGSEQAKISIEKLFKSFSISLIILAILGLVFVYFNSKATALIYIAIIMLTSAFYSISLAKQIDSK
ncbi:hypothetical protein [Vagococcus zengguangii]|uniref:Uncharacterized protein n=1 Tax=Vagococcus zengguangii TaxID=2571750 RepID=A0A4D7CX59_9ENTE|nr:hypothetical protein [Vagococcus zengguangii]QCI86971.1 hypothetical protein FA707_08325 [Vagococcus zengguangii]TLG80986.1 hypothetical protein FE258_03635 [Vagococcus zengguangii]